MWYGLVWFCRLKITHFGPDGPRNLPMPLLPRKEPSTTYPKDKRGRLKSKSPVNSGLPPVATDDAKPVLAIKNVTMVKWSRDRLKLARHVNGFCPGPTNDAKPPFSLTTANPLCIFCHTQRYALIRTNLAIVTLVGDRVGSDKPIEVRGCHINKYRN